MHMIGWICILVSMSYWPLSKLPTPLLWPYNQFLINDNNNIMSNIYLRIRNGGEIKKDNVYVRETNV